MPLSEFDLIQRYFSAVGEARNDVVAGVGDDCALLRVPPGEELAVTTDTLVEGVHFLSGCDPEALGHKALAVNLSDLAAMGARPAWVTLTLTLPRAEERWLAAFSRGFAGLARRHRVRLVGGDTSRGPLSVTVQAMGLVPAGQALRRDGARPGDLVAVTGTLGDAGLALQRHLAGGAADETGERLDRPAPRVAAGLALRGLASAAIDISDGLLADLDHICTASGAGATLELADLPLSPAVARAVKAAGEWTIPLSSGDDYELCVTLPPTAWESAATRLADAGVRLTRIGMIDADRGIRCRRPDGTVETPAESGYRHFTEE